MIEFNIYFCIKQGKSVTFSTLELALDVRRLTSSLIYHRKHPTPMKIQLHPQCLLGIHCSMEIPLDIASVWYWK